MSTILKAGRASAGRVAPSVFHMRDLTIEAEQVINAARAQAAQVISEARQQAELLRENAHKQGYHKGFQQGRGDGRQQGVSEAFAAAEANFKTDLDHLARSLAATIRQVSEQRFDCLHAAEHDLLSFAVDIARRVTKSIGELNSEAAQENLRSALSLVMAKSDLTVKAHPDDLAALKRFAGQLADELASRPHITFVEDATVSRGGVQVVTDAGEIDATLDEQVEQIAKALAVGEQE